MTEKNTRVRRGGMTRRIRNVLATVAATVGLVAAGSFIAVEPTQAAWTDTATARSGQLSAAAVPSVPGVDCAGSGGTSVTLSWPDLGSRYEYLVVARDSDGGVYANDTVRGNGTTASFVLQRLSRITYTTYEHPVTVTPRLIGTTWQGATTTRSVWERYNTVPGINNRVFCTRP